MLKTLYGQDQVALPESRKLSQAILLYLNIYYLGHFYKIAFANHYSYGTAPHATSPGHLCAITTGVKVRFKQATNCILWRGSLQLSTNEFNCD